MTLDEYIADGTASRKIHYDLWLTILDVIKDCKGCVDRDYVEYYVRRGGYLVHPEFVDYEADSKITNNTYKPFTIGFAHAIQTLRAHGYLTEDSTTQHIKYTGKPYSEDTFTHIKPIKSKSDADEFLARQKLTQVEVVSDSDVEVEGVIDSSNRGDSVKQYNWNEDDMTIDEYVAEGVISNKIHSDMRLSILSVIKDCDGYVDRNYVEDVIKQGGYEVKPDFIDYVVITKTHINGYRPSLIVFAHSIQTLRAHGYLTDDSTTKRIKYTGKPYSEEELVNLRQFRTKSAADDFLARQKLTPVEVVSATVKEHSDSSKSGDSLSSYKWRDDLLNKLQSMDPYKFEELSRDLLVCMGFVIDESIGTSRSRDFGIDGFGYITGDDFRTTRVGLQSKRYARNKKVGSPEIQQFFGSLETNRADYGVFITTSDFTKDAITTSRAGSKMITLINGDKLVDLMAKYELHVKPVQTYVIDDYFDE